MKKEKSIKDKISKNKKSNTLFQLNKDLTEKDKYVDSYISSRGMSYLKES